MKCIYLTFTLTFLACAWANHGVDEEHLLESLINSHIEKDGVSADNAVNNYIDTLLQKVLDKVQATLKKEEPYPLPNYPNHVIKDENVQVTVSLSNMKENKGSSFVVNKLENSIWRMTEKYDVTIPQVEVFGDYKITGKVLGKKVNGKGKFQVWGKNVHAWGTAYAHLVDGYVQIKQLDIDYTVQSVTAKATGLTVEGVSKKETQKLLSNALEKYFTDNEKTVSATASSVIVAEVNKGLYGMSITDLIKWFKKIIESPTKQ